MKDLLKEHLNKIHRIDEDIMDEFLTYWKPVSYLKKELVTIIDKTEHYLYFIVTGSQKAYYLTEGNEFIIAFSRPYNFTCIPESFLTQEPSNYNWECITDSQFLRISHKDFIMIIEKNKELERLLWKQLIGTLSGIVSRYHQLIAFPMEERFIKMLKKNPNLLNIAPQKDVANYLRIHPTNFSKLLNRIKL